MVTHRSITNHPIKNPTITNQRTYMRGIGKVTFQKYNDNIADMYVGQILFLEYSRPLDWAARCLGLVGWPPGWEAEGQPPWPAAVAAHPPGSGRSHCLLKRWKKKILNSLLHSLCWTDFYITTAFFWEGGGTSISIDFSIQLAIRGADFCAYIIYIII